MVKSCISPDGQYIVSGSEDGKPFIWNTVTHENYRTKKYEAKFLDLVSDTDWNPKYNMFSLTGFGHYFPILIYVYQRTEEELNEILYSGQGVTAITDNPRDTARYSEVRKSSTSLNKFGKENEGFLQKDNVSTFN